MRSAQQRPPKEIVLTSAGAVLGLAIGIAIARGWNHPAPSGQLPGLMSAHGLGAGDPIAQVVIAIVSTFLTAAAASLFFTRRMRLPNRNSVIAAAAMSFSLPVVLLGGGLILTLLTPLVASLFLFRPSVTEYRVSRHDLVLIPIFTLIFICFAEALPLSFATALAASGVATLILRGVLEAVATGNRYPAQALTLAPAGFLLTLTFSTGPHPLLALSALLWIVVSTMVLGSILKRPHPPSLRRVVAFVIYPLVAFSYPFLLNGAAPPILDLFENGHNAVPAMELQRGETLYRDVIPIHGPIGDAWIDAVGLHVGGSLGSELRLRKTLLYLTGVAVYFVTLAATGSPEVALLAPLLATALSPTDMLSLRAAPALFILALAVAAVRRRSRKFLMAAAAVLPLAVLTSFDFGAYAFVVLILAACSISPRRLSLRDLALSLGGASIVAAIVLAAKGILMAWMRTTFIDLPSLSSAYVLGPFAAAECCERFLTFPEILYAPFAEPKALPFLIWFATLVFLASYAATSWGRRRNVDALALCGVWIVLTAGSFAERRHLYFTSMLAPMMLASALLLRRHASPRFRFCGMVLIILMILWARPTEHLSLLGTTMKSSQSTEVETPLPAAGGTILPRGDIPALLSAKRFVDSGLMPNETFLDFCNVPMLYPLLKRPLPIRYTEVPLYEKEKDQLSVIAVLEKDPSIRAVLVDYPYWSRAIDGVPNQVRAPLVWNYLLKTFRPAFSENGVVFWVRHRAGS